MAPRPRVRSSSRKDSPLSPPKPPSISVVIDAPPNHNKRRTRSSSQEVAAAQQQPQDLEQALPTVAEEDAVSEQAEDLDSSPSVSFEESLTGSSWESLLDALDRDAIIDNLVKLRNDSDGVFSMFEGGDDRVRDICAKLLQLNPLLCRKLTRREEQLLATMEVYGGNPGFIVPGIVTRKIVGDGELHEINNGPWRPDSVLYLANLALQLAKVLHRSTEERHTYLEFMFNNFPEPFHDLDAFPVSADMVKGTLLFHTEILTQFYIRQVEIKHHEAGFDPDALLGAVFYDERNKIKGSADNVTYAKALSRMSSIRSHINMPKHPWLNVEALRQQFPWSDFVVQAVRWSLAYKKELDGIIKSRGGVEELVDLLLAEDLQDEAALSNRLTPDSEIASFASRKQESATADTQTEQVQNANNKSPLPAEKGTTGSLLGKAMKANINRLKAIKVQHSARTSGAKIEHIAAPSPPEPEHEIPRSPSPVVDETQPSAANRGDSQPQSLPPAAASDEEIVPTQQTNIVLETVRRQNEQSDKENRHQPVKKPSLLDRQKGAERVEWEEPSDDNDTPSPPPQALKRRLPRTFEDDGGHDEFETDQRTIKRARASAEFNRQPPLMTRPSIPAEGEDATTTQNKDVRLSEKSRTVAFATPDQPSRPARTTPSKSPDAVQRTLSSGSSQPTRSTTQRSPSGRALLESIPAAKRKPPPSSAPARSHPESARVSMPPSTAPPVFDIDDVNRKARERVRMSRELLPDPQRGQVRIPYTNDEVERLMELIALYGTQWVRILEKDRTHEKGPVLLGRTQVQLKDKARNMKLVFLKAGHRLPPGFELVSVGQRQINELRKLGIDYIEGQSGARYTAPRDDADPEDDDDLGD
ncbi:hypothetical protein AYL99_06406 [Fonsecaea erecta]|uniref:Myb-like domain-containing protein n=1 Tax=Fonsecaea erecta TaxID=1367422 RepID=A0A178ZH51_9EURO|nr:hypothetical protein AYL99_06406 [Fonsecaea erecta]OAP59108.1 hypothetical protein AYL99_06406 [Fonsecaea erecta]